MKLNSGRYEISRLLGSGEMGEVWLAYDRMIEAEVALKFPDDSISDLHTEILRRETLQNRTLSHPHLLEVYDFVYPDGKRAAISMEYAPGGALSQLLTEEKPFLEVSEIEGWIQETCAALTYLHEECGLVHRGLKATNLLFDAEGRIKVADYGLSARIAVQLDEESQELIGDRQALHYASPQLVLYPYESHASHDIYALGVTIFHLLTGTFPFSDPKTNRWEWDPDHLLSMSERRALTGIEGEPIPDRWNIAVARCLAENPEDRPSSASALALLLSEEPEILLEGEEDEPLVYRSIQLPVMSSTGRSFERSHGSLAWFAISCAAIGLLAGILLGLAEIWKVRLESGNLEMSRPEATSLSSNSE